MFLRNVTNVTVAIILVAGSNTAFSGDKEGATTQVPGFKLETTTIYSGTKQEYVDAVRQKQHDLKTQGGAAMNNPVHQPTKETTVRTEKGGTIFGSGGTIFNEKSLGHTSAAEEALRNHQQQKK